DFPFFFSSRRRHTRFSRDWSSDVCSSDLSSRFVRKGLDRALRLSSARAIVRAPTPDMYVSLVASRLLRDGLYMIDGTAVLVWSEIGRASCRERVGVGGGCGRGWKPAERKS